MTTTDTSDRFTTLPDDQTLAATVVALEEHGFSVEMVDDLAAARNAVLARIPHGPGVHQADRDRMFAPFQRLGETTPPASGSVSHCRAA
jgi:hypothetical protein